MVTGERIANAECWMIGIFNTQCSTLNSQCEQLASTYWALKIEKFSHRGHGLFKNETLRHLINLSRRDGLFFATLFTLCFELIEADQWCLIKLHQLMIFFLKRYPAMMVRLIKNVLADFVHVVLWYRKSSRSFLPCKFTATKLVLIYEFCRAFGNNGSKALLGEFWRLRQDKMHVLRVRVNWIYTRVIMVRNTSDIFLYPLSVLFR